MGLFVVICLIKGKFNCLGLFFLINWILWFVLGFILIMFFFVSVFKCFLVVLVFLKFNVWVILVCVGGMFVFLIKILISFKICDWCFVNGCI